jgi:hypothetical protein
MSLALICLQDTKWLKYTYKYARRIIRTSKVSSTLLNIVLDVQDVSNGVYILSFYDTDGNIENSKSNKIVNTKKLYCQSLLSEHN